MEKHFFGKKLKLVKEQEKNKVLILFEKNNESSKRNEQLGR